MRQILVLFIFSLFQYSYANESGFLKKYCFDCHSNKKHKGGVNFEDFKKYNLLDAMEQVQLGEMPPKKYKLKPTRSEVDDFVNLVKVKVSNETVQTKFRWMMANDHELVIRDFFGISDFESSLPKRMKNAFLMPDSQDDEINLSGSYVNNLIKDNSQILDQLYPPKEEFNQKTVFDKGSKIFSTQGILFANEIYPDGSVLMRFSGPTLVWEAPYDGVYKINFRIDEKITKLKGQDILFISPVAPSRAYKIKPGQRKKVNLSKSKQIVSEELSLRKGEKVSITLAHTPPTINNVHIFRHKEYVDEIKKTGVKISNISLQGPVKFDYSPWNKLFKFPKDKALENISHWLDVLHSGNSDKNEFYEIYENALKSTNDKDLAYKETLKSIINDYRFTLIDDYSSSPSVLAHRLYRQLKGTLPQMPIQGSYRSLINELTEDTSYFSRELADNWLATSGIFDVSFSQYEGIVGDGTKKAIAESMYAYLDESIQKNLSLKSLVKSDIFMSCQELSSKLSDIPNPQNLKKNDKYTIKNVEVPESRKFGILTHPAFHAAISNGDKRPNPIVRAAWIYKQILGKLPPEPPNEVPNIDPNVKGLTDIRAIVNKHKEDPTCYNCHMKFDGLGFAMESYDSLGKYAPYITGLKKIKGFKKTEEAREEMKKYSSETHLLKGKAIYEKIVTGEKDCSGEFYGGKIQGLASLSDYLTKDGYKTFKVSVISRMYEQLICRSLTASERLKIQGELDKYSDNLKELLKQMLNSSLFIKNKI